MSPADSDQAVQDLLKQAKEAVRAGDKAAARALLEEVVSKDQNSEQGWFWLAAAVDDINEKCTCLGNVLVINPNNERARRLLDQLRPPPAVADDRAALLTSSHKANHRLLYVIVGLGGVAVIALLAVMLTQGGGDGANKQASSNAGTVPPPAIANQPSLAPGFTPTPSRTPLPPPPTWTPQPSNTPLPVVPPTVFPRPPSDLPGSIIMRAGQIVGDQSNQPIVLIKPDGSGSRTLAPDSSRGHSPILSPDSSLFAYIKYLPGSGEVILQIDNLQGTAPVSASAYWGGGVPLFKLDTPAWSPDGNWIAFVAQGGGAAHTDLYRVSLTDPAGNPEALQQLTSDNAAESWPAWSPDSQQLVYAADLTPVTPGGGTELRIYSTVDGQSANLTTNGEALIESAPDWSPDGQWIVFQALEAGSSENDIYQMVPGGAPEKIIDSDADDIHPRFSPDGRYIVFSSDRSGNWDVYLFEIAARTIYQVTTSPHLDIANDWGR